eukprot:ANDGO_08441.mRNA.1 hypothetical protein GUITHDRAFT_141069
MSRKMTRDVIHMAVRLSPPLRGLRALERRRRRGPLLAVMMLMLMLMCIRVDGAIYPLTRHSSSLHLYTATLSFSLPSPTTATSATTAVRVYVDSMAPDSPASAAVLLLCCSLHSAACINPTLYPACPSSPAVPPASYLSIPTDPSPPLPASSSSPASLSLSSTTTTTTTNHAYAAVSRFPFLNFSIVAASPTPTPAMPMSRIAPALFGIPVDRRVEEARRESDWYWTPRNVTGSLFATPLLFPSGFILSLSSALLTYPWIGDIDEMAPTGSHLPLRLLHNQLEWSERSLQVMQTLSSALDVRLAAYDLRMCGSNSGSAGSGSGGGGGVSFLGNVSRGWPLALRTSTECLALPADMLLLLARRIPLLDCSAAIESAFGVSSGTGLCRLRRPVSIEDARHMPRLSFVLSESPSGSGASAKRVRIAIGELIMEDRVRVCIAAVSSAGILSSSSISSWLSSSPSSSFGSGWNDGGSELAYGALPPIVLGTRVIEALGGIVAVDFVNRRIGLFSNSTSSSRSLNNNNNNNIHIQVAAEEEEEEFCEVRAECTGEQFFWDPLYACVDPDCSPWLFKTLDPALHKCVARNGYTLTMVVLLLCVVVGEFALRTGHKRAVDRAVSSLYASASASPSVN